MSCFDKTESAGVADPGAARVHSKVVAADHGSQLATRWLSWQCSKIPREKEMFEEDTPRCCRMTKTSWTRGGLTENYGLQSKQTSNDVDSSKLFKMNSWPRIKGRSNRPLWPPQRGVGCWRGASCCTWSHNPGQDMQMGPTELLSSPPPTRLYTRAQKWAVQRHRHHAQQQRKLRVVIGQAHGQDDAAVKGGYIYAAVTIWQKKKILMHPVSGQ
ncbi:uncharacterized protein [Syngnathus scovelli]|uniref:uncharacterized protein n=1 Tax=Syngnathus scovelli TaxID=161590 RepID=UPI00210F4075|nr:uncharacterized protein LOC125968765 isoform X2 [Syngnathus scovelli]